MNGTAFRAQLCVCSHFASLLVLVCWYSYNLTPLRHYNLLYINLQWQQFSIYLNFNILRV